MSANSKVSRMRAVHGESNRRSRVEIMRDGKEKIYVASSASLGRLSFLADRISNGSKEGYWLLHGASDNYTDWSIMRKGI